MYKLLFIGGLGMSEILLIALVVLLFFGGKKIVGWGYVMFLTWVAISYFLISPLSFRFLGTYQVADDVMNMISLQSYMSTLILMCLAMGIVFEMPLPTWLFAKMGFITSGFLKQYRKHAIVIILIVAAIITPTSDIFTLLTVSLPMWALYEVSILIIKNRHPKELITI